MKVQWYRSTTLVEEQTYNVDSALYFCDTQVASFNRVVITIGNMTKPNRFLKIFNIADGITRQFYNDELENVEIIEEITNNNQAININEADLTILPQNNTGVQFQRTLPFSLYRNDELYGRFFIDKSTSNSDKTLYKIDVKDYIKTLDEQTYLGGIYSTKQVSSLIADILGSIPYSLDSSFNNVYVSGYLPILTKREALRQVAFIINAYVDTSRADVINIKPFSNAITRALSKGEVMYNNTTQSNIVTKMELETTLLTQQNAEADEIFNEVLIGTQTIIFDSPKFNLSITGGTIDSSNCNYAIISSTGNNVVLTGKTYEQYTKIKTKTNDRAVSTDIENIQKYETTLTCNTFDILDKLKFTEYTVQSKFKMDNTKVGDLVNIDHMTCRVSQLSYDLKQTNIYADAQLERFYIEVGDLDIITEAGVDLTTENNIVLEAEE